MGQLSKSGCFHPLSLCDCENIRVGCHTIFLTQEVSSRASSAAEEWQVCRVVLFCINKLAGRLTFGKGDVLGRGPL